MSLFAFFGKKPGDCSDYHQALCRAERLLQKRRWNKAELWAKRALELSHDNSAAHMQLAEALLFQMRYEEALVEVDRVIELHDYNLGDAFFLKGRILYDCWPYQRKRSERLARLHAAADCLEKSKQFLGDDETVESVLRQVHKMIRSESSLSPFLSD